jgi:hypothetical protein
LLKSLAEAWSVEQIHLTNYAHAFIVGQLLATLANFGHS